MNKILWSGILACLLAGTAHAAADYPSGYTKCVKEGGSCNMSGARSVAFGKSGNFVYATLSGSFTCQASLFPANSISGTRWCSYAKTTSASSSSSVPSSSASSSSSKASSSSSSKAASSTPANGAGAGFWNAQGAIVTHDPTIINENGTWRVFQTGDGIQGKRSTDNGYNWSGVPQIFLSRPSWWKTYVPEHTSLDVWAPDIEHYNGRVWMYYSISSFGKNVSAIGLVSAPSIASGSWRDDGLVLRSTASDNFNAIDPNLTFDKDGNPWLAFGSFWSGLKIVKIDKSTMKPTGSISSIAFRSGGIEAPSVLYRDGYYYLFASIDKCCSGVDSTYKIIYGRSKNITGPYVDRNGVSLLNGGGTVLDSGNNRWVGPGGQDIYRTSQHSVIARHAYDANDNGTPKLLVNDLKFSGGWPTY